MKASKMTIEKLREENKRLRATLKPVLKCKVLSAMTAEVGPGRSKYCATIIEKAQHIYNEGEAKQKERRREMKTLEQLGISPSPWSIEYDDTIDRVVNILDANNKIIVETDYGFYPPELPDARLMKAAPKLYVACYEMLRYYYEQNTNTTVFNIALELMKQAVAEAAGESEVKK